VSGSADVLKAADDALYQAKALGRNNVVYKRRADYIKFDGGPETSGATGATRAESSINSLSKKSHV
jgi:hypothetical protein